MSARRPVQKPIPEAEIEDEDEEMDFDDEDMEEMPDFADALGAFLATEDGETVATALVSLKDASERIATSLEMQNKILVKILSTLTKTPAAVAQASPSTPEAEA
jgi:hypothetical protein